MAVSTFECLQKWEGTVLVVEHGEFTARLVDLTYPRNPREEATFSLDDISPCDVPLVQPGAVFYWSIGYEVTGYGQRKRISIVRLRRLWTRREIESVEQEARDLEWLLRDEPEAGHET